MNKKNLLVAAYHEQFFNVVLIQLSSPEVSANNLLTAGINFEGISYLWRVKYSLT